MTLQHTPLNAIHRSLGARMVDFGGWDMHSNIKTSMDRLGPQVDRAVAALVEDLRAEIARTAGSLDAEDAKLALAGALDQLFKFQPLPVNGRRPVSMW